MKIYTIVVLDTHSDPSVYPCKSKSVAIIKAKELAAEYCRFKDDYEEKTLTDWNNGAIFRVEYSCEGDNVTVYENDLL